LNPSQLKQTVAVADMKALDKFLRSKASKFPDAFAQANEIRGQFIGGVMSWWRPAVLLRPAWTMRVVGDEQLRMMAKIGSVEHLWALLAENRPQYVEKVLQKALVKTGKYDPTAAKRLVARRNGHRCCRIVGSEHPGGQTVASEPECPHQSPADG
jgi:hypothetical protein